MSEATRRSVLAGAAAAGTAAALAGGGDGTGAPASSTAARKPVGTVGSPDAVRKPDPVGNQPQASASEGPILISDIPVGGGAIYDQKEVVVTQPTAGVFKVFDIHCTHEQCFVTDITDGLIICPCHGSEFAIDSGAPQPGSKATKKLPARQFRRNGNEIVIS